MNEPVARRTIFAGFRQAALELWGEDGLAACAARLSAEARAHCIEPVAIKEEMLPERYVMEWYVAAWEGPAERNRQSYNRWLQRMMDLGFGKVRKLLLSFASVEMIARQSERLWSHDHSHGTLVTEMRSPVAATTTLSDHPYIDTPLGRASASEICRYAVSLARVGHVTCAHRVGADRSLVMELAWEKGARASAPTR